MTEHPGFAYDSVPGERRDVLVLCDHASHAIPPEYGDLGLDAAHRLEHLAWDIGAAAVAREMARALACPAYLGVWSRLAADLNRAPDADDLIVCETDGYVVNGNRDIGDAERRLRIERFHRPYHDAIDAHLHSLRAERVEPVLISIHSFAPVFGGRPRPWPIGLLWKRHEAWIDTVLANLRAEGFDAGDNEPYDGRVNLGYTLERHALRHGYRHVLIELRQDLLGDEASCIEWAERCLGHLVRAGFLAAPA